jgi:uncharacterized protein YbaR (Trm112 family)
MAELTPGQQRIREQIEGLIATASPLLDLVLGVGERISRIVEPEDHEYYPVRAGGEPSLLPPEARSQSGADRADEGPSDEGPSE